MLLLSDWLHATDDAARQNKLLDDATALVAANPTDLELASAIEQSRSTPRPTRTFATAH